MLRRKQLPIKLPPRKPLPKKPLPKKPPTIRLTPNKLTTKMILKRKSLPNMLRTLMKKQRRFALPQNR